MKIQIHAADTLFFRDGKPFAMGEENWANGVFPDMAPGVLLGALRTVYAAQKGLDRADIAKETENSKIVDYGICLGNDLTFPVPIDLIGDKIKCKAYGLLKEKNESSSNPFSHLLCSPNDGKADDLSNWRMTSEELSHYLDGGKTFDYDEDLINLDDFITSEPKIGIGRNRDTNTTREGALYRVGMTRLQGREKHSKTSFWVDLENLNLEEEGFVRLGAENKIARFQHSSKYIRVKTPIGWGASANFKLYLSTPAIFEKGIIPKWIDEEKGMRGEIPGTGIGVRLETCAVGRYLSFGGFDLKKYRPKEMQKAVPGGSVYYFELEEKNKIDEQINVLIEHFSVKRNSFSEFRINEGLGKAFIGKQ